MNASANGFILLPVLLTMSLIAAIAFVLNRDNGVNAEMVSGQMDSDRARYAAEAGLQAVNAVVQTASCAGGYPLVGSPVINNSFGGASYSAYATSSGGNTTGLVSVGSYNGTSVSLSRSNAFVYQSASKTYTLQPDAAAGIDTYITQNSASNNGASSTLSMANNTYPLLRFNLSMFPAGSVPVSATLALYGGFGFAFGTVNAYRMLSAWQEGSGAASPVDGANWLTMNGTSAWSVPGGDYHAVAIASGFAITGAWLNLDISDMSYAWLSGRYPNNGLMLGSSTMFGSVPFTSSDSSDDIHRPKLIFNYLLPCGTTGPSDPVSGTATLSAVADTFDDSGAALANNGAATSLKVYHAATRDTRSLMRFDVSSIPTGAKIKTATLRLYVSAVSGATKYDKAVWVNAPGESWVEGSGNNSNKSCPTATAGASWSYSNNCSAWAFVHPPNSAPLWSAMAPMPTARSGHVVVAVNNKIYAIGGYNSSGYLKVVEEYDPATNTWKARASMPTKRSEAAAAVVGGMIYVMGGTDGASSVNDETEAFDPVANVWASKKTMPEGRRYLSAAVVNDKIYALGGATNTAAVKLNEEYDPKTNKWTVKANMPTARMWLAVQSASDRVFAIGGYSGSASIKNTEAYDPATNSWSTLAPMPAATDSAASAAVGNRLFIIGGFQGSAITRAAWLYDALNNTYSTLPDYPMSANEPSAAALNGKIYSVGGDNNSSTYYANHYLLDPGLPAALATAAEESGGTSPLSAGFSSGWITFDLTALVQEWVDGVSPNSGIVVHTDVPDQFSINSRENASKTPQLVVSY